MSPFDRWRAIAIQFRAVEACVASGAQTTDFEPADLARLRKTPNTGAVRGVFAFLLHIYNHVNRFDLAEVQRWDSKHIAAFARWAAGKDTGWPCHYF